MKSQAGLRGLARPQAIYVNGRASLLRGPGNHRRRGRWARRAGVAVRTRDAETYTTVLAGRPALRSSQTPARCWTHEGSRWPPLRPLIPRGDMGCGGASPHGGPDRQAMQARLAAAHPVAGGHSRRGAHAQKGEACRLRHAYGVGQQRRPGKAGIRGIALHHGSWTGTGGWVGRHAEYGRRDRRKVKLQDRHNGRLLAGCGRPESKGGCRGQPAQCQHAGQQPGAHGERTAKSYGQAQAAGAWAAEARPGARSADFAVACAPFNVTRPAVAMDRAGRRTRRQGAPRPSRKRGAWGMRAGGRPRARVRQARVRDSLMDVQVRDMAHSRPVCRLPDDMADRSAGGAQDHLCGRRAEAQHGSTLARLSDPLF